MKWFKLAHPFAGSAGSFNVLVIYGRMAAISDNVYTLEVGRPWTPFRERYEKRDYVVTELKDPDTETVKA